jgi:hypothetical protein
MPIDQNKALPYGLRDVKLMRLTDDGTATVGGAVDLPASRTLSFSETEEFSELRGDDRVVASRGGGPMIEWDLEAGGISLEAYAIMAGGTIVTSGSTPNVIKRFRKLVTDSRPYFKIEGQAINDNGGDFHGIIYRAKADGALEGSMGDSEFWLTAASGKGYGSLEAATLDAVYDFIHNETATAILGGNAEIQQIVSDAAGGTFTITFSGQTTSALAFNVSVSAMQTALEALSNIAPGDVSVTGAPGNWTVRFSGVYANTNVGQMTLGVGSLTGGSAAVVTVQQGG